VVLFVFHRKMGIFVVGLLMFLHVMHGKTWVMGAARRSDEEIRP
jgi:hypothetical protein